MVTLWLLSTDNLTRSRKSWTRCSRSSRDTVQGLVAEQRHVNPVGALDLLPADTARVVKDAATPPRTIPGCS